MTSGPPTGVERPRAVDVRFPGGDRELAGTLLLPPGPGPFPAAVLVSGSGPVDRDSDVPRLRLGVMRDVAEALAARGVASLRYDKRGVGASRVLPGGSTAPDGDWLHAGLCDNADDVHAALAYLARRPAADPARLVLVGHSEGALLVARAAADLLAGGGPRPAGVVLLSASARPGDEVLRWQASVIAPTLPRPVRALLRLTRTDLVAKVSANHDRVRRTTGDVARIGGRRVNARWIREFLDHDPRDDLRRLDLPVLAVTGSADLQVDPADLVEIERLVPGPVRTWEAPGLSHVLRSVQGAPSLSGYKAEVRRPVDPELLEVVTAWVAATTS